MPTKPKERVNKVHQSFRQGLRFIINWPGFEEMNHYRHLLWKERLIGHNHVGYGNISEKIDPGLIISATQTGHLPWLKRKDWTRVTDLNVRKNTAEIEGMKEASSELFSHEAILFRYVVHAHSPRIWKAAKKLGLPTTSEDIEYGTPEMAYEITQLLKDDKARERRIFATLGHEDGVFSFANSLDQATAIMLGYQKIARNLPK